MHPTNSSQGVRRVAANHGCVIWLATSKNVETATTSADRISLVLAPILGGARALDRPAIRRVRIHGAPFHLAVNHEGSRSANRTAIC